MADALNINLKRLNGYRKARSYGLIDEDGKLIPRNTRADYMCAGGEGIYLYDYIKSLIDRVISHTDIVNISHHLDRGPMNEFLARSR